MHVLQHPVYWGSPEYFGSEPVLQCLVWTVDNLVPHLLPLIVHHLHPELIQMDMLGEFTQWKVVSANIFMQN